MEMFQGRSSFSYLLINNWVRQSRVGWQKEYSQWPLWAVIYPLSFNWRGSIYFSVFIEWSLVPTHIYIPRFLPAALVHMSTSRRSGFLGLLSVDCCVRQFCSSTQLCIVVTSNGWSLRDTILCLRGAGKDTGQQRLAKTGNKMTKIINFIIIIFFQVAKSLLHMHNVRCINFLTRLLYSAHRRCCIPGPLLCRKNVLILEITFDEFPVDGGENFFCDFS